MSTSAATPGKASGGTGDPGDLAAGFAAAVRGEPAGTTSPLVATAFSLGWYVGALCREGSVMDALGANFTGVNEEESINVCLRQAQVRCLKLAKVVEQAGQEPLDTAPLAEAIAGDISARPERAQRLDITAFSVLSAVDSRLGRAYRLGRDLLALTTRPTGDVTLKDHLSDAAVAPIVTALDDLSSALPPHAGHAVRASLVEWNGSVAGDGTPKFVQDAVAPETPETWALLRRQGQMWRAVLAGEKSGPEMLEIDDYLDAAKGLSMRLRNITGRLLRDYLLLVVVIVLLFVAGILIMVLTDSAATAAAGAGAVLTSLGLSWRGIGTTLGRLAKQVEEPLWGAEVDRAITRSITLLKPMEARDTSRERQRFAVALEMAPEPGAPGRGA